MLVKDLLRWVIRILCIIILIVIVLCGIAGIVIDFIQHPKVGIWVSIMVIVIVSLFILWAKLEWDK